MPARPGKRSKEGNDTGIMTWTQGSSTKHDYGGLEDKIDPWLLDCFNKCDEKYPVLNQITQVLYLMCVEDCRREFLSRAQPSSK